jgi:aryl-alcohol dehydrogenase-like predicted oxidoreductase
LVSEKNPYQQMRYRRFGRTEMLVSEIGYGMWGMAGWTGTDRQEVERALDLAVELGCNFFDTAWAYGDGISERMLGELMRRHPKERLYAATKIPPKNRRWPSKRHFTIDEVFPKDYIVEYTERSLANLGVDTIDLMQFHVWEDHWARCDEWKAAVQQLSQAGKVRFWGVSINRWEPENALDTLRTGLIDAVQVIYNIFDQNPEDALFPLCRQLDIGVIARVPFDEGTLTGTFTKDTVFPADDWRSTYFVPENLTASVERADALKPLVPPGMSMAEMALRFILGAEDVHTTIPGMRQTRHVRANLACSDGRRLPAELRARLTSHRWNRQPTEWSQ